jgi:hypothetical protein
MFHALHAVREPKQSHVELDVLLDNSVARRIYQSVGFRPLFEQRWVEMPLPDGADRTASDSGPEDLDEATRTQREYGFSEFRLHVGAETYPVGRLGHHLFRIKHSSMLSDRAALGALQRLDPRRSVLCIVRGDCASAPFGKNAVEKARSTRLVASLDHVLDRLSRFAFL